ncbi:MAG: hypothetical protein ACE367_07210 [Acidimicrobiales bacterium]
MSSTSSSARARAATAAPPDLQINNGVIVVTDDRDDTGVAAARGVAAELGERADVPVILYDRSAETWVDTPHPEGPLPPGDRRLEDRPHLRAQMQIMTDRDIDALAWLSTVPTIAGITGALTHTRADVVVVAASAKRKFLERTLDGDSISQAIAILIDRHADVDASVIEVADDGTSSVIRTGSASTLRPGDTPTGDVRTEGHADERSDQTPAHGASTLTEVLREAAGNGYEGEFFALDGGRVRCGHCNTEMPVSTVHVEHVHRLEGASDPDDLLLVASLRCPACDNGGTLTLGYGPNATGADVDVLRELPTG